MDMNKILDTLATLIEQTKQPNFLEANRDRVSEGLYDIIDTLNAAREEDINSISDKDYNNLTNQVLGILDTINRAANMHADIIELRVNFNKIAQANKNKSADNNSQSRG